MLLAPLYHLLMLWRRWRRNHLYVLHLLLLHLLLVLLLHMQVQRLHLLLSLQLLELRLPPHEKLPFMLQTSTATAAALRLWRLPMALWLRL